MADLKVNPYPDDESLISEGKESNRFLVRIYRKSCLEVVLGRGSDPEKELYPAAIHKDTVPVFRRRGGGCSVVLDEGNLVIAVLIPLEGLTRTKEYFQYCTDWVINGLSRSGIDGVYQDGVSDLVMENRKIGGSCVWRTRGLFYYTVSLLVNPNLDLLPLYLKHPPREPEYRQGRSHLEFVTSLERFLPNDDPVGWLLNSLKKELTETTFPAPT